ncbi:MAG: hypothetical protein ACYDC6_13965 [Acidobacteriaceae bacterium]
MVEPPVDFHPDAIHQSVPGPGFFGQSEQGPGLALAQHWRENRPISVPAWPSRLPGKEFCRLRGVGLGTQKDHLTVKWSYQYYSRDVNL